MDECSQLILESRKGDMQAFSRLVEMHQQYAFRIAHRYLMDADTAKDVVQEAFIRVWKHLHRFRLEQKFSTWLYRIVVNLCYDSLRRQQVSLTEKESAGIISEQDTEKEIEDRDKVRLIKQLLFKLPAKQRIVFMMRDLDDMNIDEIAKTLNMSKESVKSNLYYARKALREKLTSTGIQYEK